jgi:hypothetical protein
LSSMVLSMDMWLRTYFYQSYTTMGATVYKIRRFGFFVVSEQDWAVNMQGPGQRDQLSDTRFSHP